MNFVSEDSSVSLSHHGILGMRWGVRRYQNSDGSLTSTGKKKVSSQYTKTMQKARSEVAANNQKRYVNAYNATANQYNNGKIDAFNKKHKPTDPKYEEKYMTQFGKDLAKNFNKMTVSEIEKNANYKKAQSLVEKYNMGSFDQLAQANAKAMSAMRKGLSPDDYKK